MSQCVVLADNIVRHHTTTVWLWNLSAYLVQLLLQHSWVLLDLLHKLAHQLINEIGTHWKLIHSYSLMWLAWIIRRLHQQ